MINTDPCAACKTEPRQLRNNGDRDSYCHPCRLVRNRAYYHKNREKLKEKTYNRSLARNYGIDIDAVERMREAQGNSCAICGVHASKTPKRQKLHVDHDHATGTVRGLLCHQCNVGLGAFKDNLQSLAAAANYLKVYAT